MKKMKRITNKMTKIICLIISICILGCLFMDYFYCKKVPALDFKITQIKMDDVSYKYLYTLERTGKFANDYRPNGEKRFSENEIKEIFDNSNKYKVILITYEIYNPSTSVRYNDIFFYPFFDYYLKDTILGYTSYFAYDKTNRCISPKESRVFQQRILINLNDMTVEEYMEKLGDEKIKIKYRTEEQKYYLFKQLFWKKKILNLNI